MIVKLNTNLVPIFSGTYETMWEVSETDDDGNEVMVEYEFRDLMKSIVEAYNDRRDDIVRDLEIKWIKSIKFTGSNSPREYNFSTDQLEFTANIDKRGMIAYLNSLAGDKEFEKWLYENFTSRDGFWSYTPNTYQGISNAIRDQNDEHDQALGVLIQWAGTIANGEGIEDMICEDWRCNGYRGLDYQIAPDNLEFNQTHTEEEIKEARQAVKDSNE